MSEKHETKHIKKRTVRNVRVPIGGGGEGGFPIEASGHHGYEHNRIEIARNSVGLV